MLSKLRTLLVRGLLGTTVATSLVGVAAAQSGGPGGGMNGGLGGGMGGFGWWPFLSMLAFVAVLLAVYAVVDRSRPTDNDGTDDDSALSTLRARYARGELSDEEFERRRQRLQDRG
ncbi:SHOCT domain-containing protein [Natronomonas amylolytica]|uniref:SHOCT domain-containing protein n=1 Tax=Natronomonas amylolytica TaxID=3108498 RepID=UPI00300837A9